MWRTEAVPELYAEADNPKRPVVCFDELPFQLLAEVNAPIPPEPGKPKRQDYEYERKGHCSRFIAFEPLTAKRHVGVRQHRTNADFAQEMQALVARYREADTLRVVLENLSTHTPAAPYQTFPVEEARRSTSKLDFHHTPKHGRWLNRAEIEGSVLARQALKGRLADVAALEACVKPWQNVRNHKRATVDWCFSTSDARTKLAQLYPQ